MKKQAITALFLVVLTVGMASTAIAAPSDGNEDTNVTVTVNSETLLDVKPDSLNYNGVDVGNRLTSSTNDHGYEAVKVENTGSNDISRIWMNTTYPKSNPFATGVGSNYDAANFLQVKPGTTGAFIQGDDSTYHNVQRMEFFQDSSPLVDTGSFAPSDGTANVGRVRLGNNEFYFAVAEASDGTCTDEIRVGKEPNTPNTIGSNDFTTGSGEYTNYSITSGDNGYYDTNESVEFKLHDTEGISGNETQSYDIRARCDASALNGISEGHILLTKYNVEAGGAGDLAGDSNDAVTAIWDSTGSTQDNEQLNPGQSFSIDTAVQVPRGVPAEQITSGTMTVFAKAYTG